MALVIPFVKHQYLLFCFSGVEQMSDLVDLIADGQEVLRLLPGYAMRDVGGYDITPPRSVKYTLKHNALRYIDCLTQVNASSEQNQRW